MNEQELEILHLRKEVEKKELRIKKMEDYIANLKNQYDEQTKKFEKEYKELNEQIAKAKEEGRKLDEEIILYQNQIDIIRTQQFHKCEHWYFNDLKYLIVDGIANDVCFYSSSGRTDSVFDYELIYKENELEQIKLAYNQFKSNKSV